MKIFLRHIFIVLTAAGLLLLASDDCHAQSRRQKRAQKEAAAKVQAVQTAPPDGKGFRQESQDESLMKYIVEDGDTIYIDEIRASKVYSRLPRQKGKDWRKYYRLVHNFSKAYPYALVAKKIVVEADSTIAADKLKGAKREKYISKVQKELFDVFEGQMRKLTVSQGALIMKLVDREVGKSSYNIIKGYKSGITAGFWQGVAKVFGSDLKKPYDPDGEDAQTEELVKIWEAGDFPAFYWSLFWQDPPELPIPEKYL